MWRCLLERDIKFSHDELDVTLVNYSPHIYGTSYVTLWKNHPTYNHGAYIYSLAEFEVNLGI